MSTIDKSKKNLQDKIEDLISYESKLIKIFENRKSTLEQIDDYSIDELNKILVDIYEQKINSKNSESKVRSKVAKLLTSDIEYNKLWINETRKKIDKLSNK